MTIQTISNGPTKAQDAISVWPVEAFQKATATCLSTMANGAGIQSEWQSFMKQRLEKDEDYPGKLLKCKTPADFLQLQFDFVNDFFNDYAREFRRLGEMVGDAANQPQ
jgi:hypothetical protein